VLSKPPDRVSYDKLSLAREDFKEIEDLAKEAGILTGETSFDDYTDIRFSEQAHGSQAYAWEAP
jgi:hypothetical protein